MTRFLAVDWDDSECRYLVATAQKGKLTISKGGLVPLVSDEEKEDESQTKSPGDGFAAVLETLKSVLKEERIETSRTVLSLSRNKVELLYLTLPPCLESEVPLLLRNQLHRELSSFSDFDPADHLVLSDPEEENRNLLALTIPLSFRQSMVRSLRSLGRPLHRIGFRPVSAAELISSSDFAPDEFEPGLVVNVVGNEVDLIHLEGKRIVSLRSFRLPEQIGLQEISGRITEEIERTVTIGVAGMSQQSIKKVFLFGAEDDWSELAETLTRRQLEVRIVHPFQRNDVSAKLLPPERIGEFAPLVGLLLNELPGRKIQLDLLHPKEPPKPANYIRSVLLAVVLLSVCGYGMYHWNQSVIRGMEDELAKLETEYKEVATQFQQVQPIWNVLRQTRSWDTQGAVWLDELRELSIVLPSEQDLVISQMSFTSGPINNDYRYSGTIQLSGMVRDPSVLLSLQQSLHAKGIYQMRYPAPTPNPAGGGYPWLFRTSIYRIKR